ncbi:vicianin hydrolase-like [Humulus lupulus]|uniref:vicianin hydrolase-like n=1 Tax=Humulus lupulus TaxID=3486 RepID=UPI002B40A0E5|nr:vicianin hydrolase-like [Humulus lupulus]
MAFALIFFIVFSLAFSEATSSSSSTKPVPYSQPLNKTSFPKSFLFGAGTAAYQSEGASFLDGKGPNIWDAFTRQHPEKIWDRSNGDVAVDFYHRYKVKEDIKLMKKTGLDSFRFSISWSRIFPNGTLKGGVNQLGVKYYNDLINALLANGIKPFVTLFHFDTPLALENGYGSWLSPKIVKDFSDYADFCFKTFGDRVKYWVTMNEPNSFAMFAYNYGTFAPGRCSKYVGNCTMGNSATEPYIVAHHLLLSHATAVKLYRQKYQRYQKGKIGITIVTHWFEPKHKTTADQRAASRALDFLFGWFAQPVTFGHYPQSMRLVAKNRLPKFTEAESKLLKGCIDFLGLNYYTANYAESAPLTSTRNLSYVGDRQATLTTDKNGIPIGTPTALGWLFIYPQGIRKLLLHIKDHYNNPEIYITENGLADANNDTTLPVKEAIKDSLRIRYLHGHLSYLAQAIREGVRVKGYYVWTFWDDFEWDAGYTVRFGIAYIDFKDNLKRHLKYSAYWLKRFLLH